MNKKKLKVLVAFDYPMSPPEDGCFDKHIAPEDWRPNRSVIDALKKLGHSVVLFAMYNKITTLIDAINREQPDIVFNLMEAFNRNRHYEGHLVSLLELLKVPYTGCSPNSITLCKNKFYTKRILTPLRIKYPRSVVIQKEDKSFNIKNLNFPMMVKPLGFEGSDGISKNSFVESEEACIERAKLLHSRYNTDAIVEEYIDGREIYAGILGTKRLKVLPLREMFFENFPEGRPRFATYKSKWDREFRKKWGIKNTFARPMDKRVENKIQRIAKSAYRALGLAGYARLDLRLTDDNEVYVIEVNPNPNLSNDDEIAYAAQRAGISYTQLISKIIDWGFEKARY